MNILQISDPHLDEGRDKEEQLKCLDQVVNIAIVQKVAVVVVCGDLVSPQTARRETEWERNTWRDFAGRLSSHNIIVIFLRGNHDRPGDMAHLADIPHTHYVEDVKEFDLWGITIHALPYIHVNDWLIGDNIPVGQRVAEIERRMVATLDGWRANLNPTRTNIVLYHGSVRGATVRVGQSQPVTGHEPEIPIDAFDGFDAALLGHIHLAQQWTTERGTVVAYAGSPWPHSHGEEEQAGKGVVVWTFEPGRAVAQQHFPLDYTRRLTYTLAWNDGSMVWPDNTPFRGHLTDADSPVAARPVDIRGATVRVKVAYPAGVAESIPMDAIRQAFETAGVASIRIERQPQHTATVKVQALATPQETPTLWAKLQAMWAAVNGGPETDAERDWARDACADLETANPRLVGQACGIQRLRKVRLENIGRWRDRVIEVDYAALGDGVIRVAGCNGAGKTSLMSLSGPGVLYLDCPNRGDIYGYAGPGASLIDVEFEGGGQAWRCEIAMTRRIDKHGKERLTRKASLYCNGEPVPGVEGKGREYLEAVERMIAGPQVHMLSTVYQVQRSAQVQSKAAVSFAESAPADRDALFRATLGLDAYEMYERACLDQSGKALESLVPLRDRHARLQDLERRILAADADVARWAADVADLKRSVVVCEQTKTAADAALTALVERERLAGETAFKLSQLTAEALFRSSTAGQIDQLAPQIATHQTAVDHATAELATAEESLRRAELLAGDAAREQQAIRDAQRELTAAQYRLVDARKAHEAAAALVQSLVKAQESERAALDKWTIDIAAAEAAAAEAQQQEETTAAAAEAARQQKQALVDSGMAAKDALATKEAECAGLTYALRAAAAAVAVKTAEVERCRAQAQRLETVPCGGNGEFSTCALLADAIRARTMLPTLEWELADAQKAAESARMECDASAVVMEAAQSHLEAMRQAWAEQSPALEMVIGAALAMKLKAKTTTDALTRLRQSRPEFDASKLAVAQDRQQATAESIPGLEAEVKAAETRLAALPTPEESSLDAATRARKVVEQAKATLTAATSDRAALERLHATLTGRLEGMRAADAIASDLADLPTVEAPTPEEIAAKTGDAQSLAIALTNAKSDLADAQSRADQAAGAKNALAAEAETLRPIAAQIEAAEQLSARWTRLHGWIRRLVTLMVEASGPAVSARINRFLARCFGDRFLVRLEPESENKSNDGVRRTYDIYVLDSETGEERRLDTYSGGEQNPLRQAISYGLNLFRSSQSPHPWGVVWVDEGDMGLDPATYLRWQQMLRAFVEDGGANQMYVVTHRDDFDSDSVLDVGSLTGSLTRSEPTPTTAESLPF